MFLPAIGSQPPICERFLQSGCFDIQSIYLVGIGMFRYGSRQHYQRIVQSSNSFCLCQRKLSQAVIWIYILTTQLTPI